jgi:3-deoxy-D-manno-octulosonic acid (KDO) 8-phosphate synthase
MKKVTTGSVVFSNDMPISIMAGPCVIESRDHIHHIAGSIGEITRDLGIGFVFKSSFDKANRTSVSGFRGPGMQAGLEILDSVRKTFQVPVVTDIHDTRNVLRLHRMSIFCKFRLSCVARQIFCLRREKPGKWSMLKRDSFLLHGI